MVQTILYLGSADIAALPVTPDLLIEAIVAMRRAMVAGRVHGSPKSVIDMPSGARFFAMNAAEEGGHAVSKWLAAAPADHQDGPSHQGIVTLGNATTGQPLAIMDAGQLTALRTAALSITAARRLAPPDARSLGLIGAGAQAEAHLKLLSAMFPIDHVRVASRGEGARRLKARWEGRHGLNVEIGMPETVLRSSDILVSAVHADPALVPFLDARLLRDGAFVSMVDLGRPWRPETLVAIDHLYTDDLTATRDRARREPALAAARWSGDLTDLAEILPSSLAGNERRGFLFAGIAAADLAIASLLLDLARSVGTGILLPR